MTDMTAVTRTTEWMRTADGIRLDADVYRPPGDGPWPVLLMRQPYGRAIASTVVYAHPRWYAARGFMVVIQDVRGRGTSEGEFRLLENERADGAETVAWAAGLPGSNGAVGMYGFSYQGMTQLLAAADRPPALRAIAPAMAAWDVHADFATQGGAFRLQASYSWGMQLAMETARRAGDADAHAAMASAMAAGFGTAVPCRPPVAELLGQHGHYLDWLTQPAGAEYWRRVSPATGADTIDVPALHIGGWYDALLGGTLAGHAALSAAGRARQVLVVGPWAHIPWSRHVGALDFGPDAANEIDALQLLWFGHWLRGAPASLNRMPDVSLFEMGGEWHNGREWPDTMVQAWHPTSSGRAGMTDTDGMLGPDADEPGADMIVFDPWRPTPSLGGHAGYPAGPFDRTQIDARSDVLVFDSPPFPKGVRLAGPVRATLHATADGDSFDLHAILSEVTETGVFEITSGYCRAGSGGLVEIDMRATCIRVGMGNSLRLSVAAGSFPAFPVNSGCGLPPGEERLIDQRIVTIMLRHGVGSGTALFLPVAEAVMV